jgi:hypothetical protein
MKKKPKDKNAYYRCLCDEVLESLGHEVYHFRNLQTALTQSNIGKEITPELLFVLDSIYQTAIDRIFDELANAKDLHMANIAIDGLEKSMRVRRGLCKKADVL